MLSARSGSPILTGALPLRVAWPGPGPCGPSRARAPSRALVPNTTMAAHVLKKLEEWMDRWDLSPGQREELWAFAVEWLRPGAVAAVIWQQCQRAVAAGLDPALLANWALCLLYAHEVMNATSAHASPVGRSGDRRARTHAPAPHALPCRRDSLASSPTACQGSGRGTRARRASRTRTATSFGTTRPSACRSTRRSSCTASASSTRSTCTRPTCSGTSGACPSG